VDPLDAFMADINAEVREDKPTSAKPDAGLALDDDDNVADFLEVCRAALHDGRGVFIASCLAAQARRPCTEERGRSQERAQRRTAAAAAAVEGAGYNSDEEVYAVARAVDADAEVRTRPAAARTRGVSLTESME
jgi:hypothetical protein